MVLSEAEYGTSGNCEVVGVLTARKQFDGNVETQAID